MRPRKSINLSRYISPKSAAREITRICERADLAGATPVDVREIVIIRDLGSRNKWTQLSGGFQASRSRSTSLATLWTADNPRTRTECR